MKPQVVIVGSGVAGILTANRLARSGKVQVTVVNTFRNHLNQPAFLYLPFGIRRRTEAPAKRLLLPPVRFAVAKVASVDVAGRRIHAERGGRIAFDFLVLATGSRLASGQVPGLKDGAHNFHCRYAADLLAAALDEFKGGRIVVGASRLPYKCPPSPHEFALLLHDFLQRRRLRDRTKLSFVFPLPRVFSQAPVARMFEELFHERRIEVVTDFKVESIARGSMTAADGRTMDYDLLVMVPPHTGAAFLKESGLAGDGGWVPVDPATLRVGERVYALGDAADLPVPKSGAAAHYQSKIVADNILAEAKGREPASRYDGRVT